MKSNLILSILFVFVITSGFLCSKEDSSADPNPNPPGGGSGVYAVYSKGGQWRDRKAFLWKDETQTDLSNKTPAFSQTGTNLYTTAVAVSSAGDVYVAGGECLKVRQDITYGSEFVDSCYTVLWKNGVKQNLNSVPVERWFMKGLDVDMALNGNDDVFVLGRDGAPNAGEYSVWKNGNKIFDIKDTDADVSKIFAKNSDVYVCGKTTSGGATVASLWKNGTLQVLNGNAWASTVCVSDNNEVYVGLADGKLLKNNTVQTSLRSLAGKTASYIAEIVCSGADVFVLGYCAAGDETIIWKNGTQLYKITSPIPAYNYVGLYSLSISGGDVYASGVLSNASTSSGGPSAAVIFKNGTLYKTLFDGNGILVDAPSVFVK